MWSLNYSISSYMVQLAICRLFLDGKTNNNQYISQMEGKYGTSPHNYIGANPKTFSPQNVQPPTSILPISGGEKTEQQQSPLSLSPPSNTISSICDLTMASSSSGTHPHEYPTLKHRLKHKQKK